MNAPRRAPRLKLDGVLLLDKATGQSSNHALQAVRRLYNAEKAGHTGTLDPLATGLLPVCFGEATKFSSELLLADKSYEATVQLGVTTVSADSEGQVLEVRPVNVSREQIESVMNCFRGPISQLPPMYSALKRDGKPLYEYARDGIEVDRQPRTITVYELQLLGVSCDRFSFTVRCSKGTYVRTLAADIGEALGCGAHLTSLRRTGIGALDVALAHGYSALESLSDELRQAMLLPVDSLLLSLPLVELDEQSTSRILHGQAVQQSGDKEEGRYRMYDPTHRFLGVGSLSTDGWLRPQRLIAGN